MSFKDFTLEELKEKFSLEHKVRNLFTNVQPIRCSEWLQKSIRLKNKLPIKSEKAKSEMILAPILLEIIERNEDFLTLYSGELLMVDKEKGLFGECDFIIGKNAESYLIQAPLFVMLEAKKSDIESGIPQCAAQMLAAQSFNQTEEIPFQSVYGCVTTADDWLFLKLENKVLMIDNQKYYLNNIELILGIIQSIVDFYKNWKDVP